MTIEIIINGEIYEDLKEIKVTKSLGALAGSFEFSTAVKDLTGVSIKEYDSVIVKVDGHRVITGYIDPLRTRYSTGSHVLALGGYDTTIDLVHCSVLANVQYTGGFSFGTFVNKVLKDNGFSYFVIDNSKGASFSKEEVATAKAGDSIFDFLNKYAQLKGVVINSDGQGNLVIYNNSGILSTVILTNRAGLQDNEVIISGETTYDMKDRFSKVIVKSQGGTGGFGEFSSQETGGENIEGFAEDLDVKRKRVKVIVAKSATDAEGCKNQAIWEVNKRRAASVKYTCKVQGHSSPNGELWKEGTKFPVIDTYADINSVMMLDSVVYNESKGAGTSSDLTFVAQDVYSIQSEDPTKNINKVGENRY